MLMFQTAFMLQSFFQSIFVIAEKLKPGLIMTVTAGLINIVLDALFVAVMHKVVAGASASTFNRNEPNCWRCISDIFIYNRTKYHYI